jgi:hypothetical protein
MKLLVRITLLVLLVSSVQTSCAQNITYGDDFIQWVRLNARQYSTDLARADYQTRVLNLFLNHYQQSIESIQSVGKNLDSLLLEVQQQESVLASSSYYGDTLSQAMIRSQQAQSALITLGKILFIIDEMQERQRRFDSIPSKSNFIYSGLVHVGKENVLESVVELSHSLTNTLVGDYRLGVSVTMGEDGSASGSVSSLGSNETVTIISTAGTYAAMFCHPGFAAIPIFLGTNEIIRYYEKVKEQNEKVKEGLVLFEKLVPSSDEFHDFFSEAFVRHREDFDSVKLQCDSLYRQERQMWQQLYSYNIYRLEVARSVITAEKVKMLQLQFVENGPLRKLFDARLLNDLNLDLDLQYKYIRELDQLRRLGDTISKLHTNENYIDALYDAKAWYGELKHQPVFIPLLPKISILESAVEERIDVSVWNKSTKRKTRNKHSLIEIERKLDEESILKLIAIIKEVTTKNDVPLKLRVDKSLSSSNPLPILSTFIAYNSGNYSVSSSNNNSFEQRFPDGGNIINVILSGSFDGGYRSDLRNPSGLDRLNLASENIAERVISLRKDHAALLQVSNTWKNSVSSYNNSMSSSLAIRQQVLNNTNRIFQQSNQEIINDISLQLQGFLSSQINSTALQRFLSSTTLYSSAAANLPSHHVNVNSVPILGQNLSSKVLLVKNSYQQNKVIAERYKSANVIASVSTRVSLNFSNGNTDPVFNSIESYKDIERLINNSLYYAEYFTDAKNEIVNRKPMACANISNGYLYQARLLRYYSQGLIDEYEFRHYSIRDIDLLANDYQELLLEFELSCNAGNAGDVSTPCNRFTAMALKSIYGIDDFINQPNGDNQQIPFANQMFEMVSRDEHWHLIGPASNQDANYSAALYAAEGRAVIAIQPSIDHNESGHVVIVLPGIPREGTGNPGYGNVLLPFVASWFKGRPEKTFYYKKLSYAFSNGEGVLFFYRDWP